MKKYQKILPALTLAANCLVNNPVAADWLSAEKVDFKGALLYYQENNRINATEGILYSDYYFDVDNLLSGKFTIDALSGSSPTGAVPSDKPQTFTTASSTSFTAPANEVPLDPRFKDTRTVFSATWNKQVERTTNRQLGVNFSNERDYRSLGLSVLYSYDFNNKNTTFSWGMSGQSDTISPEGGKPDPLGTFQIQNAASQANSALSIAKDDDDDDERKSLGSGTGSKKVFDLLFGITQIINTRSLVQVNYSFSKSDGYHNDPYKFISVVDSNGNVVLMPNSVSSKILNESRPNSRTKHSLYFQYKKDFDSNVLDASYRYLWDDWDIVSHTIDSRYKFRLVGTFYLEPHLRYYSQSAVKFYKPYFLSGSEPLASNSNIYASADYRLAPMNTQTVGFEFGSDNAQRPWHVSLEYYVQNVDEPKKFGALTRYQLTPQVTALMLRTYLDF